MAALESRLRARSQASAASYLRMLSAKGHGAVWADVAQYCQLLNGIITNMSLSTRSLHDLSILCLESLEVYIVALPKSAHSIAERAKLHLHGTSTYHQHDPCACNESLSMPTITRRRHQT